MLISAIFLSPLNSCLQSHVRLETVFRADRHAPVHANDILLPKEKNKMIEQKNIKRGINNTHTQHTHTHTHTHSTHNTHSIHNTHAKKKIKHTHQRCRRLVVRNAWRTRVVFAQSRPVSPFCDERRRNHTQNVSEFA